MSFVEWCNNNSGFMSAILSIVGIAISVIAIIVSVQTARMPYKKRLKLGFSIIMTVLSRQNGEEPIIEIREMSVEGTNTGYRDISISYLGMVIYSEKGKVKITKINEEETGTGVIKPSQMKTEVYGKSDILREFSKMGKNDKVYLYAKDSEGREYKTYIGTVSMVIKKLSVNIK